MRPSVQLFSLDVELPDSVREKGRLPAADRRRRRHPVYAQLQLEVIGRSEGRRRVETERERPPADAAAAAAVGNARTVSLRGTKGRCIFRYLSQGGIK